MYGSSRARIGIPSDIFDFGRKMDVNVKTFYFNGNRCAFPPTYSILGEKWMSMLRHFILTVTVARRAPCCAIAFLRVLPAIGNLIRDSFESRDTSLTWTRHAADHYDVFLWAHIIISFNSSIHVDWYNNRTHHGSSWRIFPPFQQALWHSSILVWRWSW